MTRARVGVHARNTPLFESTDYDVLRIAKIETLKMMTLNQDDVFQQARKVNPKMEFIVRLYDERMGKGRHPSPQQFVEKMITRINQLRPWAVKFEIHNEPNHATGIEGWGADDKYARDFRDWYLQVLQRLRQLAPWAQFGFPGLAVYDVPHRDRAWLQICRPAINASDWLGVHIYWQFDNMRHPEWGLRFRLYHEMFPDKPIEITEFGDSTPGVSPQHLADEYREYYTLLQSYPYVRSASAFILSSPDPRWAPFAWRKESGEILPVAAAVAEVPRRERPPRVLKAEWLTSNVPSPIPVGIGANASFVIRNAGTVTWPNSGAHRVRLGYHWFDVDGKPVAADRDLRTELPKPVDPGETVTITPAPVVPPPLPGRYTLRWDLVEEGRQWFTDVGSPPLDVEVEVLVTEKSIRTFPETGKTVEQPFLDFFYAHGLDITGYPVTDVIIENGMRSQYWQRVAMEEYEKGKVRLKLIGQELLDLRAKVRDLLKRLQSRGQAVVPKPNIVDIVDQLPRDPDKMIKRNLNDIRYVVFDHTAIDKPVPIKLIAQKHREHWPGIAYHYYIDLDGTIYQTEPLEDVVSKREDYVKGIRVAVAGNFNQGVPNKDQLASAAKLTAWLLQRFLLDTEAIKGTSDFVVTESPGRNWRQGQRWRDSLVSRVKQLLVPVSVPGPVVDTEEINAVLTALRDEVDKQQQTRDQLLAELETQKQSNAALQAQLAQAHEQLGEMRAALDRLQSLLQQLEGSAPHGSQPAPRPGTSSGRVPKPDIQDVVDSLPKKEGASYPTRSLSDITYIAVHHSAAPPNVPVEAIARYHVEHHGWPGIGYHFYIMPDGTIYQTNRLTTMSNHVFMNNAYTVGICVAGDFTQALPTPAQVQAAAHLIAWLTQMLKIPVEHVKGHREFPHNEGHTSCPGDEWLGGFRWHDMLLGRVRRVLAGKLDPPAQPLYHYLLFWQKGDTWARQDWLNSINYVARYRPTLGFLPDDASHAQKVTIVGGPLGVSSDVEQRLREAGCIVRRIAGKNEEETKAILDRLAEEGDPFVSG